MQLDPNISNDYSALLETYNFDYKKMGYYYLASEPLNIETWIIYISFNNFISDRLLKKILPFLAEIKIAFKIPLNNDLLFNMQAGYLGNHLIGKSLGIQLNGLDDYSEIAKKLIELTKDYKSPRLQSGIYLGGSVSVKFGYLNTLQTPNNEVYTTSAGLNIEEGNQVPYELPKHHSWPFKEFSQKTLLQKPTNNLSKYNIISILRDDPKGQLIKANYKTGIFSKKDCFIKEGRYGMWTDSSGLDIQDRLIWQRDLLRKFDGIINVPKVIDFIHQEDNVYLVMDYIDGATITQSIKANIPPVSWKSLNNINKLSLINFIIGIIDILQELHNMGYVHRDLTPDNFIINKENKIYAIDVELMYATKNENRLPPFEGGTVGYRPPEEQPGYTPNYKNDIYSLAAFIIKIFTRLNPTNFDTKPQNDELLLQNLEFFICNDRLCKLIASALNANPDKRPALQTIKDEIFNIKNQFNKNLGSSELSDKIYLQTLINNSISTITSEKMTDENGIWTTWISQDRHDREINLGLQRGICGILYLLSISDQAGISYNFSDPTFINNLKLVRENLSIIETNSSYGLYNGSAGIAVAISKISEVYLKEDSFIKKKIIYQLLKGIPHRTNLAEGIAGYAIALIKCANYLPISFVEERLNLCQFLLIKSQKKDGSWSSTTQSEKDENNGTVIDFEYGTAGIIWALFQISKFLHNNSTTDHCLGALEWLKKQAIKQDDKLLWPATLENPQFHYSIKGNCGVALAYIKAYELTQNREYKYMAEKAFEVIPDNFITNEFSFTDGLAGIGEAYLEAFKIFKEDKWLLKAEWISNIFTHTFLKDEDHSYWLQNDARQPYASLINGNCGIIHFLLRFNNPEKFCLQLFDY